VPADLVTANVGRVIDLLDGRYDPKTSEAWDRVGLVCGDPGDLVTGVLFAVDPDDAVIEEAQMVGANLIVTHHPLLLTGVHSVAADTAKGRIVHQLIKGGMSLFVVHTNADHARPGVSDAIAQALGVLDTVPILPSTTHPETGVGRIGTLTETMTLRSFAAGIAEVLPQTPQGVRVSGDPEQIVQKVAICGGAGDSLLNTIATAGADVFVTSDLRHHRAGEHRGAGGCALIDVSHWAAEWMWLPQAAQLLRSDAAARGLSLAITVSKTPTDPWTFRVEGN
jgi:dinuclear metal center YbgI/SA1388 family protein